MKAKDKHGWINDYRKPFLWGTTIIFIGAWFFVDPILPFSYPARNLMEGFGALFLIFGVLGRIFSSLTIASHKDSCVVKTEMYSIVRHPLYFFSFVMVVGIGLMTGRIELLLYLIAMFLVCFYPMIMNEEKYLKEKFGKEYTEYQKEVPGFIPNISKWRAREKIEINMRLVTKTMRDASLFLLIIPAVEVVEFIKSLM